MKNIKSIFFITLTLLLIVGISSVTATDNTTTPDVISDSATTTTPEIQTTPTYNNNNDNVITEETKEIQKENKNLKTATKTVEVNNYDELITTINDAVNDSDNNEYIININEGTYQITANKVLKVGQKESTIIINGNNQTLTADKTTRLLRFNNKCNVTINNITTAHSLRNDYNLTINNSIINGTLVTSGNSNLHIDNSIINLNMTNNGTLTFTNTLINNTINNNRTLIIGDNVVFGENFNIIGDGQIISNNSNQIAPYLKIYDGNYTLENITINSDNGAKTNNGNLTIINSIINAIFNNNGNITIINSTMNQTIVNRGKLIIDDDCIFGEKLDIGGGGIISYNNPNKIAYYITLYNGNYTLENTTITKRKTNQGNLTIRNSTIDSQIINNGNLTIEDDVILTSKCMFSGTGQIITNNISKVLPYMTEYNNTYTIENSEILQTKTNYGNLTIKNSTLNSTIYNYGNLTIDDDVIFGSGFTYINQENGTVIINDTTKLAPYLNTYDGIFTLENTNVTTTKNNKGNLTILNCNVTGLIYNYGNIIVKNSTMNSVISFYSNGVIIFDDECVFGNRFALSGSYSVIINDTNRISPYLSLYNANFTLENTTTTSKKNNTGNLTIRNSTINKPITTSGNLIIEKNSVVNSSITNTGNMTVKNSTLNNTISNLGTLIIEDDNIIGNKFAISGSGKVITNNTNELFPYMNEFTGETTIELQTYNKTITNSGNLTIENSTLVNTYPITNNKNGYLIIKNSTINMYTNNMGTLELKNTTLNNTICNDGTLILGEDITIDEKFKITGNGEVISNNSEQFIDYITTYYGNVTLSNNTINTTKTNNGNLTIINSIINSTIKNNGNITIDEDTIFGEKAKITGNGQIITNNITKLLPYIDTINGNYTITDTTFNKSYSFNGNITLNKCNITAPNNSNFGTLTLNNCTVNVNENNIFIDNFGNLIIRKDTEIIGQINNLGGETSYLEAPKIYVVNNRTVNYFFDGNGLTSIVQEGDTLDFQGTISGVTGVAFTIKKPINIITTTNDGKIDDFASITFTKESSGSNVTGLYTHNTQFYVKNAHNIIFDNISNVVEDKQVGWGVGQTSIRENSTNITVKNSYFYTTNNGGSSTLVLAWADNCTILNNTIIGGENVGNLLYLTTYNVEIPDGIIPNSNNKLLNNTVKTEFNSAICLGVVFCGTNNTIDGNIITTKGGAIGFQWGSGVDGVIQDTSLFTTKNNTVSNNKVYGGGSVSGGDIFYNNYLESSSLSANNSKVYNNTIYHLSILSNSNISNNNITHRVLIINNAKNSTIENNNITGDILISSTANHMEILNNNIQGQLYINGSEFNITNNNITNNYNYTIIGKGTNNIITNNYLIANTLTGDKSVNLNKETNTIENNMPYENILKVDTTEFTAGQSATITASIYYGSEVNSTISKGKVTFKVNGKTLKDANGKVIYAKVVNGVATVENYIVPDTWKNGSTIQAVYSGSADCEKLTSEKTDITLVAEEAKITTEDVTATAGSKITLKATITDNNKVINTGKVVFKINGKTVKDENGKVIYAKVVNNTVEFEYTLPDSYKAGSYNITATFISADYERLEDSKTLTVN